MHKEAVDAPSLQAFKARLDVALGSLGCWLATLHIAGGWNEMIVVVFFNPGHSMIMSAFMFYPLKEALCGILVLVGILGCFMVRGREQRRCPSMNCTKSLLCRDGLGT